MDSLLLPNIGQVGGGQVLVLRQWVRDQDLIDDRVRASWLLEMAENAVLSIVERLSGVTGVLTSMSNFQCAVPVFRHDLVSCMVECLRLGARSFTFKVSLFADRVTRERVLVSEFMLTCEVDVDLTYGLFENE